MEKLILNVEEPKGKSVVEHATGRIAHVIKPRGDAYIQKVFTGGAMKRAAAARKSKD